MCASFLWQQHQAGKAGKEGDEQRHSFLGGRKLDRLCVSEKKEVRRNPRDQQLTAEIEICGEQFLFSESWVGSELFQWFPAGIGKLCFMQGLAWLSAEMSQGDGVPCTHGCRQC